MRLLPGVTCATGVIQLCFELPGAQRGRAFRGVWTRTTGKNVGAEGAAAIAASLKANATITILDLRSKLRHRRTVALCSNRAWHFSGNDFGDVGTASISEALKISSTVTAVDLDSERAGRERCAFMMVGLTVCVSGNTIGAAGMAAIAEALKVSATVASLNFTRVRTGSRR